MTLMNRFWPLIIMLFGLGSTAGPTMGAALATGSFWTVANQHLCLAEPASSDTALVYKPCSKKLNGQAVSCQHFAGIMPLAVGCMFQQQAAAFAVPGNSHNAAPVDARRYRPPQV